MNYREIAGIILALLGLVCFSVYMAPRKKSSLCDRAYSMWMGLGIVVSATIIGALAQSVRHITTAQYFLMLACGIVWSTGGYGYALGVELIGLFRSTPLKNTSAVLGALVGVFVLHEFAKNATALALVLAGSVAIVAPAVMTARVHSTTEEQSQSINMRRFILGIFWSLWAAIAFTIYTIPMMILYRQGITPIEFLFYMSQGIFVGLTLLGLLSAPGQCDSPTTWRDRRWALLTGLIWVLGTVCSNYAVYLVGVAITWPLTSSPVPTVLFGALFFKEVDLARHKGVLIYGSAVSIVGLVLIALAAVLR